jgi:hypothetical protein
MHELEPLTEADLLAWEALPDDLGVLTHADLTNREAALTGGDPTSRKSRVRARFYRSVIEAMAGASGRVEQRLSLGNVVADLRDAASAILQEDGIDPDAPVPIDPDTLQRRQGAEDLRMRDEQR